VGAICGGLIVGQTAEMLGSEQLLVFAGFSLLPAAALSWWAYGLGGIPSEEKETRGKLALGLFKENPKLRYLAGLIFATQMVSAVLDLRFSGLVEVALPVKDERTAYFGNFYALLNGAAFVFQFGVAPVLLRLVSLRTVHLGIPVVHLVTCAVLLVYPTLMTGAIAYLVFKTVDYSVFRAAKELLYIPLSFDVRYRAKEVIDAFGYRASKGITASLLAVAGTAFGRLPGAVYPLIALGTLGVWSWLGWGVTEPQDETSELAKESV
jgi:AAA family ATP:ADP antiporter